MYLQKIMMTFRVVAMKVLVTTLYLSCMQSCCSMQFGPDVLGTQYDMGK